MKNPASKDASMASVLDSTGVDQDRGMCEEKRNDDRSYKGGTLNSGGPGCVPEEAERQPRANGDQPQEDVIRTIRESDPPIVVRDGNTGHTAKERAGRQRKQRTHFQDTITPDKECQAPCLHRERTPARVPELVPIARLPEEPGAVIPHAGICEGGAG